MPLPREDPRRPFMLASHLNAALAIWTALIGSSNVFDLAFGKLYMPLAAWSIRDLPRAEWIMALLVVFTIAAHALVRQRLRRFVRTPYHVPYLALVGGTLLAAGHMLLCGLQLSRGSHAMHSTDGVIPPDSLCCAVVAVAAASITYHIYALCHHAAFTDAHIVRGFTPRPLPPAKQQR